MLSDICADVLITIANSLPKLIDKRSGGYLPSGYVDGETDALNKAIRDIKLPGYQCLGVVRLVTLMEAIRAYHDTGPKAKNMDNNQLAYHDKVKADLDAAVKVVMDWSPKGKEQW